MTKPSSKFKESVGMYAKTPKDHKEDYGLHDTHWRFENSVVIENDGTAFSSPSLVVDGSTTVHGPLHLAVNPANAGKQTNAGELPYISVGDPPPMAFKEIIKPGMYICLKSLV
jgi:hypothetical protein